MNLSAGEPVAGGAGLDDVGAVGDAVDDSGGESFVGEGFGPLAERGVGRDGDRGAFFSFGEDLEEQLGGVLVEVDVAEFVDGEEVVAAVAGNDPGQFVVVVGFGEFVRELCAGDVAGSEPVFRLRRGRSR